ncbi:MAG: iron-sulfur cluster assembly scaffold protein [Halobacteriales archaeon]|nr:iron-sulfur cluster assembly scaffold protein [Halobacteriales archaeon]
MGMGSDMYRQQILDHYKNPRNYGELEDPDFSHVGENTSCGDEYTIDVILDDDDETIERIAFHGEGCAISKAAASMLSETVHGMTLEEVEALDRDDILDLLGVEVTPMRIKCAVLAEKILQDGAKIYKGELEVQTTSTE